MTRTQKIIDILVAEKMALDVKTKKQCKSGSKSKKGGMGFKICKNDRVHISGPVKYGESIIRVHSSAFVLSTTKRRILALVDEVANDGHVTVWVSRKCVFAA